GPLRRGGDRSRHCDRRGHERGGLPRLRRHASQRGRAGGDRSGQGSGSTRATIDGVETGPRDLYFTSATVTGVPDSRARVAATPTRNASRPSSIVIGAGLPCSTFCAKFCNWLV